MKLKHILLGLMLPTAAFAQVANISRTDASTDGTNLTSGLQNAPGVPTFQNDGKTLLVLKGGAAPITATIVTQRSTAYKDGYGLITLANKDVSVPANAVVLVGPFPMSRWNTISGTVQVSLSTAVGVSASAIRVNQ